MARKSGTVTGVVGSVVHRFYMGKAGEVNEEGPQHGSADSGDNALTLSGG